MSSEERIGWRVPSEEYERFLQFVETKRGDRDRYAWVLIENAVREWINDDGAIELEEMVNKAIEAGGYTRGELNQKEKFPEETEPLCGEDTVQVNRWIDSDLREQFMAYVKEHTNLGNRYGLALGYALREYRQNGRIERTTKKFSRFSDDLADLFAVAEDGRLPKQERQAVEICQQLGQQFHRRDLHAAIEDVTGRDSEYILDDRTDRVLDHGGYATHPFNPEIYVLESHVEDIVARRREERRRQAKATAEQHADQLARSHPDTDVNQQPHEDDEAETTQQIDVVTHAVPATDGGTSE